MDATEVKKLLAQLREQKKSSGSDEVPMEKMAVALAEVLEGQKNLQAGLKDEIAKAVSDKLADQVIEGQAKLRAEETRRGGWNTQDRIDLYQRAIDPAGLTMEQKLTMPEDQLKKYLPANTHENVRIFQELNDDAMILGWVKALKNMKGLMGNAPVSGVPIEHALQGTRTWKSMQSVAKAITTSGSATGAEWMPTQFSSQLIDLITISLKVSALFSRIDIPANTFKIPIGTTDDIAFLVPETTSDNLLDDNNVYPRFTPGTGNITFNAKKFAGIIVFSEEAEEDSIIPLLPFLRKKISNAIANAQERATLDGDITSTHMDNDVTSANDVRKAWKGIRKTDLANSNTQDLGTLNLANVRKLRGLLSAQFAENPEQLVYITSVKQLLNLLAFPEFLTVDKYGPKATVLTGEIGKLDGSPILTSKYSRDDVAATGVNTSGGPNTKGLLYLQNTLGYWYGDRRAVTIDSGRMVISGQGFMVVSQRLDFKEVYPSTSSVNKHGALGINLT